MEILFNSSVLKHPGSATEGAYRVEGFSSTLSQTGSSLGSERLLRLVHPAEYVRKIMNKCTKGSFSAEVRMDTASFEAACTSASLAVQAARDGDFAITRPPGHHARRRKEGGFCLFNNIAIAGKSLLDQGMSVFIIDIDAHYGDGTHEIALTIDGMSYGSVHQEMGFPNYSTRPRITKQGGLLKTISIPVPLGSGDDILVKAVEFVLEGALRIKPDVIGVSAGFDGHRLDMVGKLSYTEAGFNAVGRLIRGTGLRSFAVLEGGYHSKVVESVRAFVNGINGRNDTGTEKLSVSKIEALDSVYRTLNVLRKAER